MFTQNLYRYLSQHRLFTSIVLTSVLFIYTYWAFGFHYGWIDDVIQNNYLRGIGLATPAKQMYTNQVLISRLYYHLYQLFPHTPWYGYFSISYLYIATILMIYLLSRLFSGFYKNHLFSFILLTIFFYFILWIDNIVLVNFTKTAIVLVGVSSLLIDDILKKEAPSKKRNLFLLFCLLTLLLGFLNRIEIIFLWTLPLIIYFFRFKKNASNKTIILLVAMGVTSIGLYKIQTSNEIQNYVQKINHIQNITDGKNVFTDSYQKLIEEDFRYKSLWAYYWPDSIIISDSLLTQWGSDKFYSYHNLKNVVQKTFYEIGRAKYGYDKEYSEGSNWWYGFIIVIAVNIIVGFWFFFRYRNRNFQATFAHLLFLFSIVGILTLVLLFYKLEARVAIPSATIITLVSLVSFSEIRGGVLSNQKKWIFLFLLFPLFLFQYDKYKKIIDDRKYEEDLKRNIITEINTKFQNKVLFFDIWTLSLLHTSLLENIELESSNRYVTHFESWSNFVPGNVKALQEICSVTDFVSFYNCINTDKDKFVFVMTEKLRNGFIQEYAKNLHNYHIQFKKLENTPAINNIHHSLIPYRYDFGYYQVDNFYAY